MKQNNEVRFKTTTETIDKLKRNAEKLNLTLKDYLIYVGLNTAIEIKIKSRE